MTVQLKIVLNRLSVIKNDVTEYFSLGSRYTIDITNNIISFYDEIKQIDVNVNDITAISPNFSGTVTLLSDVQTWLETYFTLTDLSLVKHKNITFTNLSLTPQTTIYSASSLNIVLNRLSITTNSNVYYLSLGSAYAIDNTNENIIFYDGNIVLGVKTLTGIKPAFTGNVNTLSDVQTWLETYFVLSDVVITDTNAIHKNVSGEINSITDKPTLVDNDILLGEDSANLYSKIKVKLSNLYNYVKGKTDLIYLKLDQTTPQTIINGQPIQDTLTASQIVATDANKKLQTLAVATYPSLIELAYVKGVTSGIQGQINGKQATISTGTISQYFRGDLSLATFPTIPAAQIQSDWNQTNNALLDYIKNKPSIPAAQVNSDWNAVSGVAQILNKPTIPTVGTWGALNYPTWASGTPFVKMTAAGTFALDTNTYLTSANIDGGNVNSIYLSNQINNGGNA